MPDRHPITGAPLALTSEEMGWEDVWPPEQPAPEGHACVVAIPDDGWAAMEDMTQWVERNRVGHPFDEMLTTDYTGAPHRAVRLHVIPDDIAQGSEAVDWAVAQRLYAHLEEQRNDALRLAERYHDRLAAIIRLARGAA